VLRADERRTEGWAHQRSNEARGLCFRCGGGRLPWVVSGGRSGIGLVEWISIVCRTRDRGVKISGKFDNSPSVYDRLGGGGYGERE